MNLHINASSVQIQREVQLVQQFKRAVRKREGIIWDSWVLWVLVHDENGMPGSSGEHLVLMSREGEVIPRSPASPRPFFSFLLLSFSEGEPATVIRTFPQQFVQQTLKPLENLRTSSLIHCCQHAIAV